MKMRIGLITLSVCAVLSLYGLEIRQKQTVNGKITQAYTWIAQHLSEWKCECGAPATHVFLTDGKEFAYCDACVPRPLRTDPLK